jgi:hypothetical protein
MSEQGQTVAEVAQRVLDAFHDDYRNELMQVGLPITARLLFQQVAAGLVLALPFASLVRQRNEDALLTAIENLEGCEKVRDIYKSLSVDRAEKLWKYAEFFFATVTETQQE